MIYLLRSAAFDGEGDYRTILKIGYAKDWDKRILTYKLHNPSIKTLHVIPGGELEDEKSLHQYFRAFRYGEYGKEWYYDVEEIITFFDNNKTIEKIRNVLTSSPASVYIGVEKEKRYEFVFFKNILLDSIYYCGDDFQELNRTIDHFFNLEGVYEVSDRAFELVGMRYGNSILDIFTNNYNYYMEIYLANKDEVISLVDAIKFSAHFFAGLSSDAEFSQEMLRLNSYRNCPELCKPEIFYTALEFFPCAERYVFLTLDYKYISNYLTGVFCWEETKSLCRKQELVCETKKKLNPVPINLRETILSIFHVGDKFSKVYIKAELGRIYSSLNYKKTPKAVDLSEWFELKPGKFKNSKGKWENGFEIISLKP